MQLQIQTGKFNLCDPLEITQELCLYGLPDGCPVKSIHMSFPENHSFGFAPDDFYWGDVLHEVQERSKKYLLNGNDKDNNLAIQWLNEHPNEADKACYEARLSCLAAEKSRLEKRIESLNKKIAAIIAKAAAQADFERRVRECYE